MALPLFVYGSLKRSDTGVPHRLLRRARFLNVASMSGTLYDLGPYAGARQNAATGSRVFGELYQLSDQAAVRALRTLDKYEGPEFVRQRVLVTLRGGRRRAAWTYVLRKRPGKHARSVPSGRYQSKRGAA
jgi:gamma-glutamylcyclotransferase (GGCT)/AIG2-like uncharacterized protein YtfP